MLTTIAIFYCNYNCATALSILYSGADPASVVKGSDFHNIW